MPKLWDISITTRACQSLYTCANTIAHTNARFHQCRL